MADANSVALAALAAAQKQKQEATVAEMVKNSEAHQTAKKVESRVFYNRLAGSTYIFSNGKVAQFPHGQYVTKNEQEIIELDAVCAHHANHNICDHEVPIQNYNDAIRPVEVGSGGVRNNQVVANGLTHSLNALNQG